MTHHPIALTAAAVLALAAVPAGAVVTVYDTASFIPREPKGITLDGFGRGSSESVARTFAAASASRETFFDTWNIQTSAILPGLYTFTSLEVPAIGSVIFQSLTFNSIDAQGVRSSILFDIDPSGTLATGSGQFTVLDTCPIQSCVWIDVIGTQDVGSAASGYGGGTIAALPVPEPGSLALMVLGLASVGALVRRRRV